MTQKEELAALRAEVAELRKQMTALIETVAAVAKIPAQVIPGFVPAPEPLPAPNTAPWVNPYPIITCGIDPSPNQCCSAPAPGDGVCWNGSTL